MNPRNTRAVVAAMLANAGVAVAKLVAWFFTGAASLLAEAVHSIADTANQALLLWGGAAAQKAPTRRHAFGYGRERFFWAFVVALVLFALGSVFAISEGISKLRHPHAMTSPQWALAILGLGILLEGLSLRTAGREASRLKGRANWWTFIRRTKNPEISVVLLEDLGALVGLVIAMVSVALAAWTGDTRFDAVGSIVIGALLGAIAILLAAEMKSLLIGESATPRHEALLRETAMSHPSVRRLIHMRTQHIGPDELLVATKVDFDPNLSFSALSHEIDALENRFREALPFRLTIYVEPDVYDPTLHATEAPPSAESNHS